MNAEQVVRALNTRFPALAAQKKLVAIPAPPPLLDMGTPEGLARMEMFLKT